MRKNEKKHCLKPKKIADYLTNKPMNTSDTAAWVHGVPKIKTVPIPVTPVLETPQVYPYPCSTLMLYVQDSWSLNTKLACN